MPKYVDAQQFDQRTAIFDLRRHRHGEQIRGAVHYDPGAFAAAPALTLPVAHDGSIVVYAEDDSRAEDAAKHLEDAGYAGVAVLRGGIRAWKAAGLPVEEASQEQPIPEVPESGIPRG